MATIADALMIERSSAMRWRFVVTIFAGSFLLFLVQPLIARMALPRLGGAPAVWNSAMLVYQALLLGGYAFAHWLGRFAPRRQAMIQCGALALAATMLPIGLVDLQPPPDASPFLFVPWLLLVSIGPLFLFVSAQAPLIQRWYSASGGGDPYPLYAASNLGSFSGLIAYPLLAEPLLSVASQSRLWSAGFVGLVFLVAVSAIFLLGTSNAPAPDKAAERSPVARSTLARWIILSAIPSGLMLSTTLHLTTDLVAMPLLWVVPLGLYLLSFSVAFAENRRPANLISRLAPVALVAATYGVFADVSPFALALAAISLVTLFALCVALHSQLFELRPDPSQLTRFYLAMSVGGVIGGLFCALIAPLLFDWTYEHPLLLVASAWLIGGLGLTSSLKSLWASEDKRERAVRWGVIALLFLSSIGIVGGSDSAALAFATMLGFGALALVMLGNRLLFALTIAAMMLSLAGWNRLAMTLEPGRMTRSFFGIYSIRETADHARLLFHGTTIHGIEAMGSPQAEMRPTSYYAPRSGVGLAMRAAPALYGPNARIDVVGLGAGTLACYSKPGQHWRFYEIDPVMADIARDPAEFRFLARCQPKAPIVIGDARVSLGREPSNASDILIVDAFSSDAVPMHLLTLEAFDTYRRHLAPGGLLMVHISNRFLDLKPVLAAAAAHGWNAKVRYYEPGPQEQKQYFTHSLWVALSGSPDTIAKLQASAPKESWSALPAQPDVSAWTDDFASILPIIKGITH